MRERSYVNHFCRSLEHPGTRRLFARWQFATPSLSTTQLMKNGRLVRTYKAGQAKTERLSRGLCLRRRKGCSRFMRLRLISSSSATL
jgi:hypothetical protein